MQRIIFSCAIFMMLSTLIGCNYSRQTSVYCPALPSTPGGAKEIATGQDAQGKTLLSFRISETPESILDYYREALLHAGWRVAQESPDGERLTFPGSSENEPCVVDILASKAVDGNTKVLVNIIANGH